jgi:hypothetical protein
MIEPKTLDALNYFLDEDIQNCKDSITEFEGYDNLIAYYNGQIKGLEYAKDLVNQNWKSNAQIEAENYFKSLSREELKNVLTEAGFEVEDGEGKVIFTDKEKPPIENRPNGVIITENFKKPKID